MAQNLMDFGRMGAAVRMFCPNRQPALINHWINERIRAAVDSWRWYDLMVLGVVSIPDAYTTGTVTVSVGSNFVTGVGTSWPTNDAVNTTIPNPVLQPGVQEVTPASMTGITAEMSLYVDASGTPEVVQVLDVGPNSFTARFAQTHNPGATITASSLVARQFRLADVFPIFTINAVPTATQLILDNPWGGPGLATQAYQILKLYYTVDPMLRNLYMAVDQTQGIPLDIKTPQELLNIRDPQRQASSDPQCFAQMAVNRNYNTQYEIWPPPLTARQIAVVYFKVWPELKTVDDLPPPFINPYCFINGAIADALRFRSGKDDPFHNPGTAQNYEDKAAVMLTQARNADEERYQKSASADWMQIMTAGGANFWRSHDPELWNTWSF